ncbi:exodeoxyribonuclease VII small subunit [Tepidamorphus gemmatus]|uniref:Exodeoxyribonuclease 7 small subunit n=1 Tax=Tepidamorphus gemmatus TaxID=747076 RepID=A0A4R3MCS9_9HYPH|nr:exodeoxyribonuclease VII small subunit [Tepidamorphus gemmatus]TCT09295.1 exodeoxyribonuclease VII small subunit [Tepidamorphus gemmatus]
MTASNAPTAPGDISALTFEQALAALEKIVERLESGNVPLEESIAMYERGNALREYCEALLRTAETKVEKIVVGRNGAAAGTAPLDMD